MSDDAESETVEYKTIRAPETAIEAAREAKGENETWGEYLLRAADETGGRPATEDRVREIVREMVVDGALSDS